MRTPRAAFARGTFEQLTHSAQRRLVTLGFYHRRNQTGGVVRAGETRVFAHRQRAPIGTLGRGEILIRGSHIAQRLLASDGPRRDCQGLRQNALCVLALTLFAFDLRQPIVGFHHSGVLFDNFLESDARLAYIAELMLGTTEREQHPRLIVFRAALLPLRQQARTELRSGVKITVAQQGFRF